MEWVNTPRVVFRSFSYAGVNRIRFEGIILCRNKEVSQTHARSPLRKLYIEPACFLCQHRIAKLRHSHSKKFFQLELLSSEQYRSDQLLLTGGVAMYQLPNHCLQAVVLAHSVH